jgi:hypothetical protein
MSIKSTAEFEALQKIGRIVRSTLDTMAAAVRPGISTAELNEIAKKSLASQGRGIVSSKNIWIPGRGLARASTHQMDVQAEVEFHPGPVSRVDGRFQDQGQRQARAVAKR